MLAMSAFLGVSLFTAIPVRAYAQDDPQTKIIPSLEYEQADVREALKALFRTVGVSYAIAPEVQGTVTLSLKNVSFETALQNITRQVDATYRIEGGVYQIVRREQQDPTAVDGGQALPTTAKLVVRRIKIRSADPQFIALMIGKNAGSQAFTLPPELSSIAKNPGGGNGGGGGGGGFGGGSGGGSGGGGGFGGGGGGGSGGGGFGGGSGGGSGGGGFGGGGGIGGGGGGGFGG